MHQNLTKAKLKNGGAVIGGFLGYNAPWLVEVMGAVGFDFVVLDIEHEPLNEESVANLIRTADGAGLTAIVRMSLSDRTLAYLDVGVQGIQIPSLESKEHAERIVEFARFYPQGKRTYYTQGRAANYSMGIDERKWTQQTNDELLIIGMIEDIHAVDRLDEILSVDGIDAIHVGPLDLAQSMGLPPKETLDNTIVNIVDQCLAAGKAVAVGAATPWGLNNVTALATKGVQIFNVPCAWLFTHTLTQFFQEFRGALPKSLHSWHSIPSMTYNPYVGNQGNQADPKTQVQ